MVESVCLHPAARYQTSISTYCNWNCVVFYIQHGAIVPTGLLNGLMIQQYLKPSYSCNVMYNNLPKHANGW